MLQLTNQKGASLIEALLATLLLTGAVITLSLAFPQASKNVLVTRQNWVASNLSSSQMSILKTQSYDYIDPTAENLFSSSNCDCRTLDFSVLPSTSTALDGITYRMASCVNYVAWDTNNNVWAPQCPSVGDPGNKTIVVRTRWTQGTTPRSQSQTFSMSRS